MEDSSLAATSGQAGDDAATSGGKAPLNPPAVKKTRLVFRLLFYAVVFTLILFFSGRQFIHSQSFKAMLEETFSRRLGMTVLAGDVRPVSGFGWGADVDRLVVLDESGIVIHARKAVVDMNLAGLLKGDVKVSRIWLSGATLNLVRDELGFINVERWSGQTMPFETIPSKFRRIAGLVDAISMDDCSVSWMDKLTIKPEVYKMALDDLSVRMESGGVLKDDRVIKISGVAQSPKGPGRFKVSGRILWDDDGKGSPGFDGDVSVGNLDLGHFWPYLGKILPFQRLDSIASIEAKTHVSADMHFYSKGVVYLAGLDILYSEAYRRGLKEERVRIEHDAEFFRGSMRVSHARLKAGDLDATISGGAENLDSENPSLFLKIDLAKAPIISLKKYVPFNFLTEQQASFIEKNIESGDVAISGLAFDGDLATLNRLDLVESYKTLSGELTMSGLDLVIPGLKRKFIGVDGTFNLSDNKLAFDGLTGKYGKSELYYISGLLENLHGWPTFEVDIRAGADLEETREGLASLAGSEEFKDVFGMAESISGHMRMDLLVKGDSARMKDTLTVEGEMDFNSVRIKTAVLKTPLEDINGRVKLDLDKVVFEKVGWNAGGAKFSMSGSITEARKPEPMLDLKLTSNFLLEDLVRAGWVDPEKVTVFSGPVEAKTRLSGGFDSFRHTTKMDLVDVDLILGDTLFKRKEMPAEVEISGLKQAGQHAKLDKAKVWLGESEITAIGDISGYAAGKPSQVEFQAERLFLDDIDFYTDIFDNIESKGYITLQATAKMAEDGGVSWRGKAGIVDGRFKISTFTSIFDECLGDFELIDNNVFFTGGSGLFGKGKFAMSGLASLGGVNEFRLSATTSDLDLEDLFGGLNPAVRERPGKKGYERMWKAPPPGEKPERKFFDGYWDIMLTSGSGKIGDVQYENLDTRILYDDDVYTIDPFTFTGHGGRWRWTSQIVDMRKTVNISSQIEITDLALERLGGQKESDYFIKGPINVHGRVNGHGRTWKQIRDNMDGQLSIRAGKGVINRFSLLSKIFSLLNPSQYFKLKLPDLSTEGLPFDGIAGDIDIAAGVAYTENLVVDSEAIRLSAVGKYGLNGGSLDIITGAMPFVTIDRVISSIPVAGDVLAGGDKGLVGYYFQVRGPVDDPEIKGVTIEALASGVKGIFERIMKLPAQPGKDG